MFKAPQRFTFTFWLLYEVRSLPCNGLTEILLAPFYAFHLISRVLIEQILGLLLKTLFKTTLLKLSTQTSSLCLAAVLRSTTMVTEIHSHWYKLVDGNKNLILSHKKLGQLTCRSTHERPLFHHNYSDKNMRVKAAAAGGGRSGKEDLKDENRRCERSQATIHLKIWTTAPTQSVLMNTVITIIKQTKQLHIKSERNYYLESFTRSLCG